MSCRVRRQVRLFLLKFLLLFASKQLLSSAKGQESEQRASLKKELGSPSSLSRQFASRVSKSSLLLARGNAAAAMDEVEQILIRWPSHAPALVVKSKILEHQNNGLEARSAARAAIDSDPNWKEGYFQLANLLIQQGRQALLGGDAEGAYESFRQILLIDLDVQILPPMTLSQVHDGIGQALLAAGMPEVAIENFEKSIALHSKNGDAMFRLSRLLIQTGADENKTLAIMKEALAQRFDLPTWIYVLQTQMRKCDWSTRHVDLQKLAALMADVGPHSPCAMPPAVALDFPLPSETIRDCSRTVSQAAARAHPPARNASSRLAAWRAFESGGRKLSVVILSGAPWAASEPPSRLLQAVPALIDKRAFRLSCVELGATPRIRQAVIDGVRARISEGCSEAAADAAGGEAAVLPPEGAALHLLLDVSGHASPASIAAMAALPAQLQVGWQGFAGTRGAAFIGFLSSDAAAAPPETQGLYSERLLYAPPSHLLSSHAHRPVESVPVWADAAGVFAPPVVSRALFRVPETAFVFAFFGDTAAIDPSLWIAWMEILRIAKGRSV